MPRMDGLELVQHARALWPELPVLLVSGRPQPPGTERYMPKPFGWDTLVHAVACALRHGVQPPSPARIAHD